MKVLWISIISCMLFLNFSSTNAELTTFPVEEDEKTEFLATLNLTRTDENIMSEVKCFDVNENRIIATGTVLLRKNYTSYIRVFTEDNEFLYGFFFYTDGSFVFEWQGENLCIYFTRSDYYVTVNANGDILSVEKAEDTKRNMEYVDDVLKSTKKTVGLTTYTLTNKKSSVFDVSYSILNISGSGTERSIILDENSIGAYKLIVAPVVALVVWYALALILRGIISIKQK